MFIEIDASMYVHMCTHVYKHKYICNLFQTHAHVVRVLPSIRVSVLNVCVCVRACVCVSRMYVLAYLTIPCVLADDNVKHTQSNIRYDNKINKTKQM